MIAVLFEAWPAEGRVDEYYEVAAELRPLLETIDGFISVERFASNGTPGKVLSLSFWRDEEAVGQWRRAIDHRRAQARGRRGIFENYRLRVAQVVRDYGPLDRGEAPADSRAEHG